MSFQSPLSLRTLFVDFNAYFASVEQQVRPELRGKPVGVAPVMAESSCCIAASYEAKRFGVKTGTSVRDARKLCPGIHIVEARPALYVDYHHRAIAAIDTVAPVRQILSIDELECELTGRWRDKSQALLIAEQIKLVIHRDVGTHLRVSIGIAPNTLLGKLASDMQKPDGLTVIDPDCIPSAFKHLPVQSLSGIGPHMTERLARAGIATMQALYDAPRESLHRIWGGVGGDEMYDKIRGVWYEPRKIQTQSLGHSHVLPPDLRHAEGAYQVLTRLTQKAAMRLRKQGFYATAMQVQIRYMKAVEKLSKHQVHFSESQNTAFFLHTLNSVWVSIPKHRNPLAVGVVFGGLIPATQHTPSLFDALLPASRANQAQLMKSIDTLNRRFGKNTLHYAVSLDAQDRAPMRIAFTRIPDIDSES